MADIIKIPKVEYPPWLQRLIDLQEKKGVADNGYTGKLLLNISQGGLQSISRDEKLNID